MMRARGVCAFSITDHDSLKAYAAFDRADMPGARVIVGIEINTTYRESEVHVLGYGIPLDDPAFNALVEENCLARERRALRMVEQLSRAGCDIKLEDVRARARPGSPLGRPHVAKALVAAGRARGVEEAFSAFLRPGKPGYVPSLHVTPQRAIEAIAAAGGVPVLAHPGRLKDYALIDELAAMGLVGLEVFYPRHQPAQVAYFREKAREYGLVMTAGADFHDPRYNAHGVGMEVEEGDIRAFLELVM